MAVNRLLSASVAACQTCPEHSVPIRDVALGSQTDLHTAAAVPPSLVAVIAAPCRGSAGRPSDTGTNSTGNVIQQDDTESTG